MDVRSIFLLQQQTFQNYSFLYAPLFHCRDPMSDSCCQFSDKTQFYIFHIKPVKFPVYDPVSIYIFSHFLLKICQGKQ